MKKYINPALEQRLKDLFSLKVSNVHNKNQFNISIGDYMIFQSYDSLIAVYDSKLNIVYVNEVYINYSKTTSKHLYLWLSDYCDIYTINNLKTLKKAVNKGQVLLFNL